MNFFWKIRYKRLCYQFRPKVKLDIEASEVLDVVEKYLKEKEFGYVNRKDNRISFHKFNFWKSLDLKSLLVSGTVIVKKENGLITLINGNWKVFLIAIPFLLLIVISDSEISTLDEFDVNIIWMAFAWLFGGNLVTRFIAHLNFKMILKKIITTVPNNG